MKKGITKGKRIFFILCTRLTAIIFAACITFLLSSSYISVSTQNGTYQYILPQTSRSKTEFEKSDIFSDLFYEKLSDVTRMCVIRNQLETKGKYDGKKIIDITSYANRTDLLVDDSVTAEFFLDDLIKWGNYDFDFKTVSGTSQELDAYFDRLKEDASDINRQAKLSDVVDITGENAIMDDNNGAVELEAMDVLIPRYKTTEGKDLLEYASNREEYAELVDNLQTAAKSLFQNYTEYSRYNKTYGNESTNIKYCYQMMNDDKVVRYSNLDEDVSTYTIDQITTLFSKDKRFVYYNSDKMQISTNTSVNAQEMRKITGAYEYSFGDNSRVWLSIDGEYPYNDVFKTVYEKYNTYSPYYDITLIIMAAAVILHLLSLILLSIQESRITVAAEETCKLKKADKFPIELFLVILCSVIYGLGALLIEIYYYVLSNGFRGYSSMLIICAYALLTNIVLLAFWLSITRRVKSKRFFKDSIIYVLFKKIRAGFIETYDNGQLVTRTWLPYLIFLCLNLVLVLLGVWGIVVAFIFDMAVGYYLYRENKSRQNIVEGIENIKNGDFNYQIATGNLHGDNLLLANAVNSIGKGINEAVATSMKDERLKADLITNVSHDIKTPLTSIINYVDLIKRENIEEPKIRDYVAVLDAKSQRLKQLTDDLVEASKISSGNISLNFEKINIVELVNQSLGEFSEKFDEKHLRFVVSLPEQPTYIMADSRRIYRVIENLYNNIYKYAMEGTRVYVDMQEDKNDNERITLAIKNISSQPLNINADELTERFIRGDVSRGTEGSGLGLSIAKNLTQALKGTFEIQLDGDLFKVILTFKTTK